MLPNNPCSSEYKIIPVSPIQKCTQIQISPLAKKCLLRFLDWFWLFLNTLGKTHSCYYRVIAFVLHCAFLFFSMIYLTATSFVQFICLPLISDLHYRHYQKKR
ncbi:hypothetical protein [Chlamydia sp. 17-3921]|uniref:hypothetical protein n=1 Tax=Chlamydia sp. 17-3921 TaxID=2675798 RepID=UPI0019199487|nr:hypothetical protein [Chlamydia sp. 17-3921]